MNSVGQSRERQLDDALRRLFFEIEGDPSPRPLAASSRRRKHRPLARGLVAAVVVAGLGSAAFLALRLVGAHDRAPKAVAAAQSKPAPTGSGACVAALEFQGIQYFGSRLQNMTLRLGGSIGTAVVPACTDTGGGSEGATGGPLATVDVQAVEGADPPVAIGRSDEPNVLYIVGGRCARVQEGADLTNCLRERLSFRDRAYRPTRITAPLAEELGQAQLERVTTPSSTQPTQVFRVAGVDPGMAVALASGEIYVADGRCGVWGIPRFLTCLKGH